MDLVEERSEVQKAASGSSKLPLKRFCAWKRGGGGGGSMKRLCCGPITAPCRQDFFLKHEAKYATEMWHRNSKCSETKISSVILSWPVKTWASMVASTVVREFPGPYGCGYKCLTITHAHDWLIFKAFIPCLIYFWPERLNLNATTGLN